MNTWTPLWSQVVESTLWEEPLEVRVLFLTMLAIKDADHVVRMPFRRLCKKSNMPPEVVQKALAVLLGPDERSIDPQPHDGRRLQEVEGGWFVLNGEFYRSEMQRLMRRFQKTEWQRQDRAKRKEIRRSVPLPGEAAFVKADRDGDHAAADEISGRGLVGPEPGSGEFGREILGGGK